MTRKPKTSHRGVGQSNSIGRKILVRSLALGLIPLIVLGVVALIGLNGLRTTADARVDESREQLSEQNVVVDIEDQAASVAREINVLLNERINDAISFSRTPVIAEAALAGTELAIEDGLVDESIEALEQRFQITRTLFESSIARNYLRDEIKVNPSFGEIFFTDANGFNVAFTDKTTDFVQRDEEWWIEAWDTGISVSDVQYNDSAGVFTVDVAVRIDQRGTGRRLGVLKTSLSIDFVQSITDQRSTDDVEYLVALKDGRLIADTSSDHSQLRMMSFSFAGGAASPGLGQAIEEQIEAGETSSLVESDFVYGYTSALDPVVFSGLDDENEFSGFDWIVVSAQTTEDAFAPLSGLEALKIDISDAGADLTTVTLLIFIAGLGIAIFMARQMAQSLVKPIAYLTEAATVAADSGLPSAVDRVNAEGADLDSITAPFVDVSTGDELETLAGAFNSVQSTAVRLAAEQAAGRRNTSEMFVNLGRRNQSLLKRQLRFIDSLEASEKDPDTLESLFKLDHLATRMRRNAESLLVLAGDRTPRRWAEPIEVRSAVEAALGEVESYDRVDLSAVADGEIEGKVVADVAHILAEVMENGLNFSPPTAQVLVAGRLSDENYVLTITDEGFGMKADEIALANERLSTVTELTQVPSQYLGLFVVARLAERHGIEVSLESASTGGMSVTVILPNSIVHRKVEETEEPSTTPASVIEDLGKRHEAETDVKADPEVAMAEAEVAELLAKAERAMAKVEEIRSQRDGDDDDSEADPDGKDAQDEEKTHDVKKSAGDDVDSISVAAVVDAPKLRRTEDLPQADKDTAKDTAEPQDSGEGVDVGGFEFKRRERKGDSADAPSNQGQNLRADDAANEMDVSQYGFTRRESRRSDASPAEAASSSAKAVSSSAKAEKTPAGKNDGDVATAAEQNRNQWGSFQRGKKRAATVSHESPAERDSDTDPENREQ